jgi:UDP-N-acetylglucosamine 2-epimerase (non-hydrolysing)
VDDPRHLAEICRQLAWVAGQMPVIFAVHPRTRTKLASLDDRVFLPPSVKLVEPLSYLDSLCMTANAKCVITDSGGLQEETSVLGVPCLTLRENTERPVTLTHGTNTLIAGNWPVFRERITQIVSEKADRKPRQIPWWDGQAAERILRICKQWADSRASFSNA